MVYRKDSTKKNLEKEMLKHFKSMNAERENPTNDEKKRRYKRVIINLVISGVLSLIIFLIIRKIYPYAQDLSYLITTLIFIGIFTNLEFIVHKNEERHRFWIGVVIQLTIVFVMLGQLQVSSIQANILNRQTEIIEASSSPTTPEIEVKQGRLGEYFYEWDLKTQYRVVNQSGLILRGKSLGFIYLNKGQANSGAVRFVLWDKDFNYTKNSYGYQISVQNIGALELGRVEFEVSHPNCRSTNDDSKIEEVRLTCENAEIKMGLNDWFLMVECPTCQTRQRCYSFYTCIINSTYSKENCDKQIPNWDKEIVLLNKCPEVFN